MKKNEIQKSIDMYVELLEDVKKRVGDERSALAIVQEVNKDRRMAQIREEREHGFVAEMETEPATVRQVKFLEKLGVDIPKGLTKQEASSLIDEELGKESGQDSSLESRVRHAPSSVY